MLLCAFTMVGHTPIFVDAHWLQIWYLHKLQITRWRYLHCSKLGHQKDPLNTNLVLEVAHLAFDPNWVTRSRHLNFQIAWDCICAPAKRGRYWEIHPRRPRDFP